MNIWKQAAKLKLRIKAGGKVLAPEQLYDLPRTSRSGLSLDGLYAQFQTELNQAAGISLSKKVTTDTNLQLTVDLIKEVFADKEAEAAKKTERLQKETRRRQLKDALASKQNEALQGMSEEEIRKELEAL